MRYFFIVRVLFIKSCTPAAQTGEQMEGLTLLTKDKITLKGTYYPSQSNRGIILLHMLNRNRHDYDKFAEKLSKRFAVVSIDFRGHGESSENWKNFTDEQFRGMQLDIQAAHAFLKQKNIELAGLIGASIGANHAAIYATNNTLQFVILLSPGLDYHKVMALEHIKKYHGSLLVVAAEDDTYAASSAKTLAFEAGTDDKILKIYSKGGHGTWMFTATDVEQVMLDWVKKV